MAGPDPRTFIQYFCHVFVVQRLIFFAVVLTCRVRSVVSDNAFASVLGKSQTDIRMDLVEVVKPGTIVLHFPAVPSKVVIVTLHVCDAVHRAFDRCHGYMGDGSQTGWIQFLCKRIQFFVVLNQLLGNASDEDLIGDSPEADGRMVVVLDDQLF